MNISGNCYNARPQATSGHQAMASEETPGNPHANDSKVDAISAVAVIAIVVITVIYWLGGM